ncbi:MAG: flagellar assembly peptidoglycan hydrolase FlgJ [Candidatus Accumulibacter sp.]|jgi:flagellar protein FlgJ|nr:flagellar assembly peptidoglycan hydrolase FlgJ [Accumulibacter sp.]
MRTENIHSNRFVLDPNANAALRASAKRDQAAALKDAARQFEGLMLQMVLKSMRDAAPQDGLFDNDQSRFFMSILDQQIAQNIASESPTGFAKMIEQQLGRNLASVDSSADTLSSLQMEALLRQSAGAAGTAFHSPLALDSYAAANAANAANSAAASAPIGSGGAQDFVKRVWPHAVEAAKSLGVPPHFVVAHSALESGWGQHEITLPDGSPSHNLFGIKAGKSWQGPSVEIQTTEYENGAPKTVRAKFRVYPSYAEAFEDYAGLLRGKARFASVLGQRDSVGFAQSLQDSGYATDPLYADKLNRIIGGATLKEALAG